jgi:hypothetical protein
MHELKMEHINVLICHQVERKVIYIKVNETESAMYAWTAYQQLLLYLVFA